MVYVKQMFSVKSGTIKCSSFPAVPVFCRRSGKGETDAVDYLEEACRGGSCRCQGAQGRVTVGRKVGQQLAWSRPNAVV